jgi:hypothetical protein
MFEIKAPEPEPVPEPIPEPEPEPEVAPEPEPAPEAESLSLPLPLPVLILEPAPEPPEPVQEPLAPQEPVAPVEPTPPFILQAAYTPLVPLPGSFLNSFYDTSFFLTGAEARIAFLLLRGKYSGLGLELAPAWTYITAETDTYTVETHFISGHLNFVY